MKRNSLIIAATLGLCLLAGLAVAAGSPVDPSAMSVVLDPSVLGTGTGLMLLGNTMSPEELKRLEEAISKKSSETIEAVKKLLHDEVEKFGTLTSKGNEKLTEVMTEAKKASESLSEVKTRLTDIEQKVARKPGAGDGNDLETKSAGHLVIESENYKTMIKHGVREMGPVAVGPLHRKASLINQAPPSAAAGQALVVSDRLAGIITPSVRRLTIRDLMPQLRTSSNLVEFVTETSFTNNAAAQFSSPDKREDVAKAESAFAFTLSNAPVSTIAHFLPVSRQLLSDAPGLQSYIDGRLVYGLKLTEEAQLLLGDGTGANLNGLWTGGTNYSQGVSNDTKLDALLKSILQVAISEYPADGIILNPVDWFSIRLLKDTQGRYLMGAPNDSLGAVVWGLPVVVTNSMTVGSFLTASFALAAAIWDREDVTVRLSEHHSDFFTRNMVAILCEERTTQTIYRSTAIVRGTLPALGT